VQDEFTAAGKAVSARWAMVTQAEVRIDGFGRATLSQAGRKLEFRVLEPASTPLEIYPTDPPPAATDSRNPGTRMLGFEVSVAAGNRCSSGDAKFVAGPPQGVERVAPCVLSEFSLAAEPAR
jgi:hypothetical protein